MNLKHLSISTLQVLNAVNLRILVLITIQMKSPGVTNLMVVSDLLIIGTLKQHV